jgi:diguanylate cyclase (GGDEF)-like protein/PAS domain S-box-containing protein
LSRLTEKSSASIARSKPPRGRPIHEKGPSPARAEALRLFEKALSNARVRMDRCVADWVEDPTSAHPTLPQASRVKLGLDRFSEDLRRARGELEAGLLEREAGEQEKSERMLVAERGLREVQARFESAFTSAPIGMALVDMDGRWLQVNDALCRITGHSREALLATTLPAITHPEDVGRDAGSMQDLVLGNIPSFHVEKRCRHAWGHYLWVLLTVSLVRDDRGRPLYFVKQVQDISERKELAARLEYLIDHDFLTGLYNRRRFQQELSHEAERVSRYGGNGAVLMIDLDHFKDVNDAFGHKAGDDLLKGVAGALKHRVRQTDLVARVGGDEFAMLLPEADADQAQIVADGIVKALSREVAVLGERSIHVTASVGVALFDGLGAAELLEFADLAMYDAKQEGRNRVAVYSASGGHREKVSARLAEVEHIRNALREERLLLYCQPIVDLKCEAVCQYELLLRLRTDGGDEPLSPASFLYVAERFGLIQDIDCWVARQAVALIAEQASAGRRLVLHVNLSGKSIGDPRVASLIEQAIGAAGIDPGCLVFELTETAAIANIEEAKSFAHRLHARGCRFALDDFGAGFGSFYYLKTLPFDYFKIDGEFIRDVVGSHMDQLVVGAIVGIAQGMGKKTIAEFVADGETARLLRKFGVDYAQGYHIARPRPVRDVLSPA